MGKAIVAGSARATVPSTDIYLGKIAEGSIVKLNESGSPVEFYVACHNYESAMNGTGRTLLVRKDCYGRYTWSSSYNEFNGSYSDVWLNQTYKAMFDSDVQTAMGTTKFYYSPQGGQTVSEFERSIFLLSVTELGKSYAYAAVQGSALPIASLLQIAYLNGTATTQWTRTPANGYNYNALFLYADGSVGNGACNQAQGRRPVFTMPSTAVFEKKTMLFKGVA